MADECGFPYVLRDPYFRALDDKTETKSVASSLPDGHAWSAKVIFGTMIYTLVYASAMTFKLIKKMFEYMAKEFNLYTSVELLYSVWGPSVGLQFPVLGDYLTVVQNQLYVNGQPLFIGGVPVFIPSYSESTYFSSLDICAIRKQIQQRLSKQPIVKLEEIQRRIDEAMPDSGIWLTTGAVGQQFRYVFRYPFGHVNGARNRFTIYVHIPWFWTDQNNDSNSVMTWEEIQDWLREFIPAFNMLVPIYEEEDSYCIIKYPQETESVYIQGDGLGNWSPYPVEWMSIDVDTTVTHYSDTEALVPTSTSIERSFVDSTTTTITGENEIKVVPLLPIQ